MDPSLANYRTTLKANDSTILLPHQFLINNSVSVYTDSLKLIYDKDFTMDNRLGLIVLLPSHFDPEHPLHVRNISVWYRHFPFSFQPSYEEHRLSYQIDSSGGRRQIVERISKPFSLDEVFGPQLQKSGSISRGVSFGSTRDLSLSSGFRLQLAGKLSQDIDIVAALTDENTPIQPEGNTQTLREFDKVFIEINSPVGSTTLGDFDFSTSGGEFNQLSRKLQGIKAGSTFEIGTINDTLQVAGAITRGKFNTNQFNGTDGLQGPYRLTGRNNERTIIVIAGTERVYINGEVMTRGESNDYTIDYTNAEVTFSTKRMITSLTRITIDFQYTDQQYTRSLLGIDSHSSFFDKKLGIGVSYFREADNPDGLIDLSLSDSDKAILRQSGGDRLKATKTGVVFVGRDSITNAPLGQYIAVDTVLASGASRFYRYSPGSNDAVYQVTFSYVGDGQGDYRKDQIGVYTYLGTSGGAYMPLIFLPLPEELDLIDLRLSSAPLKDFFVGGEYAASNHNLNRFSSLPGSSVDGGAWNGTIAYSPKNVMIGTTTIGGFDFRYYTRSMQSNFQPIDRSTSIEYNRDWNITSAVTGNEHLQEGKFSYLPSSTSSVSFQYGKLSRGDSFGTTKFSSDISIHERSSPTIQYTIEKLSTEDTQSSYRSDWLRQQGSAGYDIPLSGPTILTPGMKYESEEKKDHNGDSSALSSSSYRYSDLLPSLSLQNISHMSIGAEWGIRMEDGVADGIFQRQSTSYVYGAHWKLQEWNSLAALIDVTYRKKRIEKEFVDTLKGQSQTLLVRSTTHYNPFNHAIESDLFYELATQQSAKLQRVYIPVPAGTGNYIYLGDVNKNGIADDADFQLTRFDGNYIVTTVPTENYIPVTDIKTNARVRLTGKRFFTSPSSLPAEIASNITTETNWRVEERSSQQNLKNIYLLHLSTFQNDSTTITGSQQLMQDILIAEQNQPFSARLRFQQRKGFSQFASGNERTLYLEHGIRIQWQLVQEISHSIELTGKTDRLTAALDNPRLRDIHSTTILSDLSYRPEQNLEIGFVMTLTTAEDDSRATPIDARIQTFGLRGVQSFQGKGQLHADISRENLLMGTTEQNIPFELTGGRVQGATWLWNLSFDYRLGGNIQSSVGYSGRAEGNRKINHTLRAEVKAFF